MKTNNEINVWKIATIMLIVLILAILLQFYQEYRDQKDYTFGEFNIKQRDFNNLAEIVGENYSAFRICEIETGKCILIGSLK